MNPLQVLASLVYPPRCVFCGKLCGIGSALCGDCDCVEADNRAVTATVAASRLSGAVSACEYGGQATKALLRLKRVPDKRAARFFAELITGRISSNWPDVKFSLVVAVPLNPASRRKRGYNQAKLIADECARILGLPATDKPLARRDGVRVQHSLNLKERFANAAEAYYAANPGLVKGRVILLVDDILTTGATAISCAAALLDAGAREVYSASAAYTPQKNKRNF